MIKSLLGLGGGTTSSSTSESSAGNSNQDASVPPSSSPSVSEVKIDSVSQAAKDGQPLSAPSLIDEEAIKEAVDSYADMERLAPFRTKQLLKKALKDAPPNEPAPDECCGSSCTPCVKDLWREEVKVWKIARGIDPYALESSDTSSPHKLDW